MFRVSYTTLTSMKATTATGGVLLSDEEALCHHQLADAARSELHGDGL